MPRLPDFMPDVATNAATRQQETKRDTRYEPPLRSPGYALHTECHSYSHVQWRSPNCGGPLSNNSLKMGCEQPDCSLTKSAKVPRLSDRWDRGVHMRRVNLIKCAWQNQMPHPTSNSLQTHMEAMSADPGLLEKMGETIAKRLLGQAK